MPGNSIEVPNPAGCAIEHSADLNIDSGRIDPFESGEVTAFCKSPDKSLSSAVAVERKAKIAHGKAYDMKEQEYEIPVVVDESLSQEEVDKLTKRVIVVLPEEKKGWLSKLKN